MENDIDFSLDLDFERPTATHAYHKLQLLADMVIISANQTTYPSGQVLRRHNRELNLENKSCLSI